MKLHFYIQKSKKVYTLKETIENKPTLPAHYKFIKLKDQTNSKKASSVKSQI